MPCRYDFNDETGASLKLQNELTLVTRVACKLAKTLEEYAYIAEGHVDLNDLKGDYLELKELDDEVLTWIKNHEEKDARRKAALIESAKAKLSDEEREALGL